MKFVIATGNAHKVEEFSRMLKFLDFSAVSAKELGIDMDKAVENGDTFEQNALIKALARSIITVATTAALKCS